MDVGQASQSCGSPPEGVSKAVVKLVRGESSVLAEHRWRSAAVARAGFLTSLTVRQMSSAHPPAGKALCEVVFADDAQ